MIVDSHVHLITARMIQKAGEKLDRIRPGLLERMSQMGKKFLNPDFVEFLKHTDIGRFAALWEKELDRNGIDHAIFLPIGSSSETELKKFVSINPARFSACFFPDNPLAGSASARLAKLAGTGMFRCVKLYPSIQGFSVADKRLFPLYEAAAKTGTPVLIHFGITHAPLVDYRYTNPLDLMAPSRLFPETRFIIAHFGAGFFRELLLLGFHANNIYVDTSGTNNWRIYLPSPPPLARVFKRTLEVYGADRVIFGTDSALNGGAGYRDFVLKEQVKALKQLKIPKKQKEMILGGNSADLFHLNS